MANLAKIYGAAQKKGGQTDEDRLLLLMVDLKKAGFNVAQREDWSNGEKGTVFTLEKDSQKTDVKFRQGYSTEPRSLAVKFTKMLKDSIDFIPQGLANLRGDLSFRAAGKGDNAPCYLVYQPEDEHGIAHGKFYINSARERERLAVYLTKKAGENTGQTQRRNMLTAPQA